MIINKINIIAYGGIKNKIIQFDEGVNIIYGPNEAGKSTIQSFIKSMLYGFSVSRTKDKKNNERLRYIPINGDVIKGELYITFENRSYVIRKTFGKNKKDDECFIQDGITGEEIQYISKEEPGKYFLGINRATFSKTVFIEQLGVLINKDKEEEIMEKAVNLLGGGDESISLQKVFDKLENVRKTLTNQRKSGKIDNLKRLLSNAYEEQRVAYKISESNLDNERDLIKRKERKVYLNKEIKNLDIYKKYLKKIKLQEEYKEITTYLKKSEELKEQVKEIDSSLISENGIVDEGFISELKEENSLYLSIIDLKTEESEKLNKLTEILDSNKEKFKELLFVENLENGVKEKLIRDSIELENLKDNKKLYNDLNSEINSIEDKYKAKINLLGKAQVLVKEIGNIKNILIEYEETLLLLRDKVARKDVVNTRNINETERISKNLFVVNLVLGGLVSLFLTLVLISKPNIVVTIIWLIIMGLLIKIDIKLFIDKAKIDKGFKEISEVEGLKSKLKELESSLERYKSLAGIRDDKQFFVTIKKIEDVVNYINSNENILREKKYQIQLYDIHEIEGKIEIIKSNISRLMEISNSNSIEEIIEKINLYDKYNKEIIEVKVEAANCEESIDRHVKEIIIREERIRSKLKSLGLEGIDLNHLDEIIIEIKDKLQKKQDVKKTLDTVEETYKALIKGKNIEDIKEDLGELFAENINYSYESEEEIDNQIRIKSNELIEVEKEIKDLEYTISASFIGKRKITNIEEDISIMVEKIEGEEKKLRATELVIATLKDSVNEMRSNFGPKINQKVLDNFVRFTDCKYNEVLVSDQYEMLVRNNDGIFESTLLSNGANDQLYLSLRMAFIDLIFENTNKILFLDDAFMQYDDNRTERALDIIIKKAYQQVFIFTCHSREKEILINKYEDINYINL